jgi:hypothetical protein
MNMGGRFWLRFLGLILVAVVVTGILLAIFGAALETWGLLGGILLALAVLCFIGWRVDSRRPKLDRV